MSRNLQNNFITEIIMDRFTNDQLIVYSVTLATYGDYLLFKAS